MATVDALEAHELIKVKLLAFKEDRKSLVRDLADKADCTLAGVIGHVVILYREPPDNEKRKIKLESS
jgi:RNA-binding protein